MQEGKRPRGIEPLSTGSEKTVLKFCLESASHEFQHGFIGASNISPDTLYFHIRVDRVKYEELCTDNIAVDLT